MSIRSTLRRWHVWLGWLVGVPLLMWTLSGLVMVVRSNDVVRGVDLLAPQAPVRLDVPPLLPSTIAGLPLARVSLEQRVTGPVWVIEVKGGPIRRADPSTGTLLPTLGARDAAAEVRARYQGQASITSVTRTSANNPPLELRRPIEAWRVQMSDGTRFYVDAATGGVVATRTGWWRFYDFMWGLHIMDLRDRESTHHPILVAFAALTLVTVLLALVLLPLVSRRRRS